MKILYYDNFKHKSNTMKLSEYNLLIKKNSKELHSFNIYLMDYAICCALFASLYQGDKCKNFNILYFNSKPILKAITEKFDVKKAEKGFEKITIKFSLVELIIITRVCLDINFANLSGLNKSGVVKII